MNYFEALKKRRSHYDLSNTSPISDEQIKEILKEAVLYTPSAFHSESARVVLLLNEQHQKLWEIVKSTLKQIVPPANFAGTEAKLNSFAAGHGTILYFEDMSTVEQLQKDYSLYADNFPVWSMQSAGMLQHVVWTALATEGLGASLQHYNPLIDEQVKTEFHLASNWKLIAQMPFGAINTQPEELERMPIEDRFQVLGEKHD